MHHNAQKRFDNKNYSEKSPNTIAYIAQKGIMESIVRGLLSIRRLFEHVGAYCFVK